MERPPADVGQDNCVIEPVPGRAASVDAEAGTILTLSGKYPTCGTNGAYRVTDTADRTGT